MRQLYFGVVSSSLVFCGMGVTTANAASVTNNVIFGSGNANGSFTVGTGTYDDGTNSGTVELGLRAKVRFNDSNLPENTFNWDGTNTYTMQAGLPPTGFGFAPGSSSSARWNFEWSINTNSLGSANGFNLDDLTYQIRMDFDPSAGEDFFVFDPINAAAADHAIGTNATGPGDGTKAADAVEYGTLISTNNLAQNSWNLEFFDDPVLRIFNGALTGEYSFELEAFLGSTSIASTSILVQAVPLPGAAPLMLSALAGMAWVGRRSRRKES